MVIYHAGFDIQMLIQSGRHYHLIGDWSDYFHDYRWQPLPGGDHTARRDCLATLKLIRMMASTPLSWETLTLRERVNSVSVDM